MTKLASRICAVVVSLSLVVNTGFVSTGFAYEQDMPELDEYSAAGQTEETAVTDSFSELVAAESLESDSVEEIDSMADETLTIDNTAEEPSAEDDADELLVEEETPDAEAVASDAEADAIEEVEAVETTESAAKESALPRKKTLAADIEEEQTLPTVRYRTYVQGKGWQAWSANGEAASTPSKLLNIEALRIELRDAEGKRVEGITYQAYMQNIGWQDWVSDGTVAGAKGKGLRTEAIRVKLSVQLASQYDVWYRARVQKHGWLGWAKNGAAAGSSGKSLRVQTIQVSLVPKGDPAPSNSSKVRFVDGAYIALDGYVHGSGWVSGTSSVGTAGEGLRLEGIRASLSGAQYKGGVRYSAHVSGIGWQKEVANGRTAGKVGKSKRVEAITMRLTGSARKHYDLWYRLHVQSFGWLGWAQNGGRAGTEGLGRKVDSIEVQLLPKGSAAPSSSDSSQQSPYISAVSLKARVRLLGNRWQSAKDAGKTLGSTKQGKAIERLRASVSVLDGALGGGISYKVRPEGGSWQGLSRNGATAGVVGEGIDGVRMSLTGGIKSCFRVWYRAYVTNYGWLAWVRNGKSAGTEVAGTKIEALQVTVLPKWQKPSGKSPWSVGYMTNELASSRGQALADANAAQRRLVQSAYATPSAPAGYCAMWVEDVYANAGFGTFMGDACDLYDRYCFSSDLAMLKCGMIVAVSTHPHTSAGSIWGHVGIYVGDGKVMDSVYGYVRTSDLEDWIDYYGVTVPVKWGWIGNINIA